MKDALHNLPKTKTQFLYLPLPEIENIEDSNEKKISDNDLESQGIEKTIIPSNIIDIYSRLEVLLGFKLSGHNETLTEASNLLDEFYKRRK